MDTKSEANIDQMPKVSGDEVSLGDLLRSMWRTRRLVITVMVLTALSLAGLLTFMRIALPSTQTFRHGLHFVFPNVSKGQYPNGSRFTIFDLISPIVLNKVFTDNKLEQYGIKQNEFASALNVSSYSNIEDQVIARYRVRLSNRKLLFVERKDIEADMARELKQISRGAILTLTLQKRIGISKNLGQKLLYDIAQSWADTSINEKGVLDLPESLDQKALVDLVQIKILDLPLAAEYLASMSFKLRQQLIELKSITAATTVVDKSTGHNISSLIRALQTLNNYDLAHILTTAFNRSLSTSPSQTVTIFKNRLRDREVERADAARQIEILKDAIAAIDETPKSNQRELAGTPIAGASSNIGKVSGTTTMYGEEFFDRLVKFVEQGLDKQGRIARRLEKTGLRKKLLSQNQKLAQIDSRMSNDRLLLAQFEAAIRNTGSPAQGNGSSLKTIDEASVRKDITNVAENLNGYWDVARRLYAAVSPRNFSYLGHLFSPIALPSAEAYSADHPLFNQQVSVFYLLGVLASGLLALVGGLLWQTIRSRQ